MTGLLDGRRILVVEDEFLAAIDMQRRVEEQGGTVVGLAGDMDDALAFARSEALDGAILDVNLGGTPSFALADELMAIGIRFIFVTGYEAAMLPERFAAVPRLSKPAPPIAIKRALVDVFAPD